jgi:hypothetical protein
MIVVVVMVMVVPPRTDGDARRGSLGRGADCVEEGGEGELEEKG